MITVAANVETPPAPLDAERAVLGASLLWPEARERAQEALSVGDFYLTAHQAIFAAMAALSDRDAPVDVLSVSEELRRGGLFDAAGGASYLMGLADGAVTGETDYHTRMVRAAALRRGLVEFSEEARRAAVDPARDAFEAQDALEARLMELGRERGYQPSGHADAVAEADALLRRGQVGMEFHVRGLTRWATMNRGVYSLVCGTRSTGKTRFGLGEIRDKCRRGIPVLFFSLEMSRPQILWALFALELDIPLCDLKSGVQSGAPWVRDGRYAGVVERVQRWPLEVDDRAGLTPRQMAARARRWRRGLDTGLIIVDYAQRIKAQGRDEREQNARAAMEMADMAKQLDLPMILLSQVTQTGRDNRLGMPDAHSRGSLEFEIAAETVIILNRPATTIPESKPLERAQWEGKAQAWISKNRNGTEEGIAIIGWRDGVGAFCDLARDSPTLAPPPPPEPEPEEDPYYPYGDPFAEDPL